jgi:alpha-amylase
MPFFTLFIFLSVPRRIPRTAMRLGAAPAHRGRVSISGSSTARTRSVARPMQQAPPPHAGGGSTAGAIDGRPAAARAPSPPPPPPTIPDPPAGHPHPAGSGHEVLVQAFHWDSHAHGTRAGRSWWAVLADAAPSLAALGATAAWLPPASASASAPGYLPTDLYTFNTPYGSETELRAALAALKAAGVAPVADAVLNHRCAAAADEQGRWNAFSAGGGDGNDPNRPSLAWGPDAIVADQAGKYGGSGSPTSAPGGRAALFPGAPNLDHSHPGVAAGLSAFLRLLLVDLGFEGLRLDYAKGYAGAHAGRYLAEAAQAAAEAAAEGTDGPSPSTTPRLPRLAVAEFWDALAYGGADGGAPDRCQAAHASRTAAWVADAGGRAGAFDMTTKGVLQAALERGEFGRLGVDLAGKKEDEAERGDRLWDEHAAPPVHTPTTPPGLSPPGLLGVSSPHAFTFVDNHDTGAACQAHWPCPPACVPAAYAFILTHPGTPCVHWRDVFPDGRAARVGEDGEGGESGEAGRRARLRAAVAALARARRAAGVGAASPVRILYCRDAPRSSTSSASGPSAGGGVRPPPRVFHPNDFINACGGDAAAAAARADAETAAAAAAWEAAEAEAAARTAAAVTPPPPPPPAPAGSPGGGAVGGYAAFVGAAPTAAGVVEKGRGGLVVALGPAAGAASGSGGGESEWPGPGPGWAVALTGPGWAVWTRE